MSVDDCIGLLRGRQGIVHTVLIISLLFLQERFLVRSDNLDELAKLSVIVSLIFLGNVAYYPHHEVGK